MSGGIRTPLPKREYNRTQPYTIKLRGLLEKVKAGAEVKYKCTCP